MSEPERFNVDGRWFYVPSPVLAVAEDDRLALALFSGRTLPANRDFLGYSLEPSAIDLTLARSGRCPLLIEHARSIDCLVGMIVGVEVESGLLRAVVRFGRGGHADRLWGMLVDGFPLSLSLGAQITHARHVEDTADGRGLYEITAWSLQELSIVVYGKDDQAHLRQFRRDEGPAELVKRLTVGESDPARAAVRRALHLHRWDQWAAPAGIDLARRLGTCPGDTAAMLETAVQAHCATLERDLAA